MEDAFPRKDKNLALTTSQVYLDLELTFLHMWEIRGTEGKLSWDWLMLIRSAFWGAFPQYYPILNCKNNSAENYSLAVVWQVCPIHSFLQINESKPSFILKAFSYCPLAQWGGWRSWVTLLGPKGTTEMTCQASSSCRGANGTCHWHPSFCFTVFWTLKGQRT